MVRDETEANSPADADLDVRGVWDKEEQRHEFRRVMPANTLAGNRVRNSAGETLGTIEEIMIDVPTGKVAYAVLSFGGFLGVGSKLFALPWESLILNERDREFVLNVDKQKLENAPGFDKDNWPDMADPTWVEQIKNHWGVERGRKKTFTSKTDEIDRRQREGTFDRDRNPNLIGATTIRGKKEVIPMPLVSKQQFRCEGCGKEFDDRSELEQHVKECAAMQSSGRPKTMVGGRSREV